MHVRVLYHDNCFDGSTSAALFAECYRRCISPAAAFDFVGLNHGPGDVFEGAFLSDKSPSLEHACVDFRYSADPRLTYWFDHHQSAFMSAEDRLHFERARNPRHFYDPKAQSCSKFLAETCHKVFGFDTTPFAELIAWADLIDGARFSSPEQAVLCTEPALQLMTFAEHNRDPEHKKRFIADLVRISLSEIAAQPHVQAVVSPVFAQREKTLAFLRQHASFVDGVVTYDACERRDLQIGKFAPYYLFPDAQYVVGLSALPGRTKVSVGSNPWQADRRTVDIAALCGGYGGGGHPAVGAVSLAAHDGPLGRKVAAEIATILRAASLPESHTNHGPHTH